MPFVKLDCKILDSSLWPERNQRDLFITALLMAEPFELQKPAEQLKVKSLEKTGFVVPTGWYGLIQAAGIGIINRCGMELELGLKALESLGQPDLESRSKEFDGRRLVRIDGGYLALNYDKYRERDYTSAERQKRYRERKKGNSNGVTVTLPSRNITQAEAEAEAEENKDKKRASNKLERSFVEPTPQEVEDYAKSISFKLDGVAFLAHYRKTGWKTKGGVKIVDWKSCVVTWKTWEKKRNDSSSKKNSPISASEALKMIGGQS